MGPSQVSLTTPSGETRRQLTRDSALSTLEIDPALNDVNLGRGFQVEMTIHHSRSTIGLRSCNEGEYCFQTGEIIRRHRSTQPVAGTLRSTLHD